MAVDSTENSSTIRDIISLQAATRGFLVRKKIGDAAVHYKDIVETIEGRDAAQELQWIHSGISVPIHQFKEPNDVVLLRKLRQRTVSGTCTSDEAPSTPNWDRGANATGLATFGAAGFLSGNSVQPDGRSENTGNRVPTHSEAESLQSVPVSKDVPASCVRSGLGHICSGEVVRVAPLGGADESNSSESQCHQDDVHNTNSPRSTPTAESVRPGSPGRMPDANSGRGCSSNVSSVGVVPDSGDASSDDDDSKKLDKEITGGLFRAEEDDGRMVHPSSPPAVGRETTVGSGGALFPEAELDCSQSGTDPGEAHDQRPGDLCRAGDVSSEQEVRNCSSGRVLEVTRGEINYELALESNVDSAGFGDSEEGGRRVHLESSRLVSHGVEGHGPIGERDIHQSLGELSSNPTKHQDFAKTANEDGARNVGKLSGNERVAGTLLSQARTSVNEDQISGGEESGESSDKETLPQSVIGSLECDPRSGRPAAVARQGSERRGGSAAVTEDGQPKSMAPEVSSPPYPILEHQNNVHGGSGLTMSPSSSSGIPENLSAKIQKIKVVEADPDDGDITKVTALSSWDETSLWGSEDGSMLDISSVPHTLEQLQAMRKNTAMELLWVQQAIQSRKTYLRLKVNLGRDTNEDMQVS